MAPSFHLIAGILLVAVALIGGGIATWHNIRDAITPRERGFVIQACVIGWLLIVSMLALAALLKPPLRYIALLVYFGLTPWLIYRWSNRRQLLRIVEKREKSQTPPP